jgi:CheY-like chemotaxis protein
VARILVVDDEPDTLISIGQVLEDGGHEVILAAGGQEALDLLERTHSTSSCLTS